MAYRVGIVGASGYGGAELLRLVGAHPAVEAAAVAAHRRAGEPVGALFPNLAAGGTFDDVDPERLAELDLVFLATPHGVSLELGADLVDRGTRVVDLSGAFRLTPEGFSAWYGEQHPRPDLAAVAVYGLTEFRREDVREARLVANPGCYPTAALLGLLPLNGLVEPGSVVIDAKSGTSGAGRGAREHLQFSHVHGDLVAYGAPTHRHTGEIERWAGLGPVSFTPHLVPMARGLLATCYARLLAGAGQPEVDEALHTAYDAEPFVHVLAAASFPHTKALAGSNGCQVSATVDARTGRVVVTAAIDNLGKGAAGQALQNINLLLGMDETTGLTAVGTYP